MNLLFSSGCLGLMYENGLQTETNRNKRQLTELINKFKPAA